MCREEDRCIPEIRQAPRQAVRIPPNCPGIENGDCRQNAPLYGDMVSGVAEDWGDRPCRKCEKQYGYQRAANSRPTRGAKSRCPVTIVGFQEFDHISARPVKIHPLPSNQRLRFSHGLRSQLAEQDPAI